MTESTEKTPAFELTADFMATTSGVGDALRQAREAQGLTLQNVALRLRLGASQIEAIESENWQGLPGRVFIVGFVRNYARFLGIADVDALVERLQKALQNEAMPKLEIKPGDVIVPQRADNRAMLIALLLLIVVILGYFLLPDDWSNALGNMIPQKNNASTVEKEVSSPAVVETPSAMPAIPAIPTPILETPNVLPVLENPPAIPTIPTTPAIPAVSANPAAALPPPAVKPATPAIPANPTPVAKPATPAIPANPTPAAAIPPPAVNPAPNPNPNPAPTANPANPTPPPQAAAPRRALSAEEQAKIRAENLAKIRAENLAKFRAQNQNAPTAPAPADD